MVEVDVSIPILQMMKMRHRNVKELCLDKSGSMWEGMYSDPVILASNPNTFKFRQRRKALYK